MRQARVRGLRGALYVDKAAGGERRVEGADLVRIEGGTDRTYLGVQGGAEIEDPVLDRRISIQQDGAPSVVLWSPGEQRARAMKDLGEGWPGMLCVETGNVADDAIKLEPGRSHTTRARVVVSRGTA